VKTKLMVGVATLALALVGAAAADTTGDVLTMHPVSHGASSRASWLAQEGRPDSQGQANQALVLEASGTPDTSAAALFRGFEGVRVTDLQSLSYQHRAGSTCTKTDPRWTLFIRGRGAKTYLINLGCAVTPARPTDDPKWIERVFTQAVIRAEIVRQVPGLPAQRDALGGTIGDLALVVDRSKGAVYLDNVAVRTLTATKVWTFAGDNGNGAQGAPADFPADETAMMAAPLAQEALWDEADVLASITPEEQALIDEVVAATG
jgi:hypothetical protein